MSNKNLVGVVNAFVIIKGNGLDISPLKRLAILFNQLFISDLSSILLKNEEFNVKSSEVVADLRWLLEIEVIREREIEQIIKIENSDYENLMELTGNHVKKVVNILFDIKKV